jgi:hypothetical protein
MKAPCHRPLIIVRNALASILLVGALGITVLSFGCATGHASGPVPRAAHAMLRDTWGIEVSSLRMSGNGHLIDFRYKVLDPAKAATLADPRYKPILIDQSTGIKMSVPNTPKMGPLRTSSKNLQVGRIYYMLFANKGLLVKAGSKVTVLIGDFKAENLTVQ